MPTFPTSEKYLSQIPALQQLINLGYTCLTPEQALAERQNCYDNVLLENILREQLKQLNRIHYRDSEYRFSEENIQTAIERLKNIRYETLSKTNEEVYDLITLGIALEQTIEGNTRSFDLRYIDWKTPQNNVFHVVPEFIVERNRSDSTARPDIVLFVNGIPLAVIECKAPNTDIEEAISQQIRNQGSDYIPHLFIYAQLLMAVNKNAARYATAGTAKKFWSIWKEQERRDLSALINAPLSAEQKDALFSGELSSARAHFIRQEAVADDNREPTEQEQAIDSLCHPERLLELTYRFIVFDVGVKKIARYQQFFVVRETLARIRRRNEQGNRENGIIWQTQGSGKSLTMVMLARALTLAADISNPRLILVTDREDLDKQLGNTFNACGLSKERAKSGRDLIRLLKNKVGIITTLVHKFDKGLSAEKYTDESADIFVIVDESHRTHFGELAAKMRRVLPNACYLGFTGTPLLRKEKNNFHRFGELIKPHYSIRQAVADKAVLPLLYEGRHTEMKQDKASIDLWFERHTAGLTEKQKADLKKKYARAEMLNKADRVIYMRAFDISEHFAGNWQGTGLKAQLVAPSKAIALQYHNYLKDIGQVSSEVIISPPDMREGHEEVEAGPTDEVRKFWKMMMELYGSEEEYSSQIIQRFKNSETPEILIVVSKLLTGFDAPKNTVLYLCRELREHTLLQAIARVNRLEDNKEFGYVIDYVNVLGELNDALKIYDAFSDYDAEDVADTLTAIACEVDKLPQRHADLCDVFQEVKNRADEEAYEQYLADEEQRNIFYERLTDFSKTLRIALSAEKFITETDEKVIQEYKDDLKRFHKLRQSVKQRYAEEIDYRDYEPKIKQLLDQHIQSDYVSQLNEPVNIYDDKAFTEVKESQGIYSGKSKAARADTIAHAIKKVINEKMETDPAFYKPFSKLIQRAIDDYRAQRLTNTEYLQKVSDIREQIATNRHDDVPEKIKDNGEACAYYGIIRPHFTEEQAEQDSMDTLAADAALAIGDIFTEHWKIDFWKSEGTINQVKNEIEDFLYEKVKDRASLDADDIDNIMHEALKIARSRRQ